MLWFADLAASIDRDVPQIINDSKTPSGRVHVGALRGVIPVPLLPGTSVPGYHLPLLRSWFRSDLVDYAPL